MNRYAYLCVFFAFACSSSERSITIDPDDRATRIELSIFVGDCPSEVDLVSGDFDCTPAIYRESSERGQGFREAPTVSGRHAVVVFASGGGVFQYACVEQEGVADLLVRDQFASAAGCGPHRVLLGDGVCSEAMCESPDAGTGDVGPERDTDPEGRDAGPQPDAGQISGEGDDDDDGLSNCFECICDTVAECAECLAEPFFDASRCADLDGDGQPNYLDTDSDGDEYPDSVECSSPPDRESHLCDYRREGRRDDHDNEMLQEDYDDDGIANEVECNNPAAGELRGCDDTDGDGYEDFRDLDSDGDGLSDAEECPGGAPPGIECLDSDGEGTPDYRQPRTSSECDCMNPEQPYSCEEVDEGLCVQTGLSIDGEGPLDLQWLDSSGAPIVGGMDLRDYDGILRELDPPDGAWLCDPASPMCPQGTTVAIASISDPPVAYLVDLRATGAEFLIFLPGSFRLGRFVYSTDGGIIESITP